jgi:hypothetical protein
MPTPHAELRAWYLSSLSPKVEHAVRSGEVAPAAARELDRQLRDLLGLPREVRREAA